MKLIAFLRNYWVLLVGIFGVISFFATLKGTIKDTGTLKVEMMEIREFKSAQLVTNTVVEKTLVNMDKKLDRLLLRSAK